MDAIIAYNREKRRLAREKDKIFLISLFAYCLCAVPCLYIVNLIQPTPIVDEIFHIPQACRYMNGNLTQWDPKITTLPGLYIAASVIGNIISFIYPINDLCTSYYLRLLNVIISIFSLYGLYQILTFDDFSKRKILSPKKAAWVSLNIALFPVSFFFNFFFYTDTLSTYFVIAMYLSHLKKNFKTAAAQGFCAVMVRQTNIIWVGYCIIDLFYDLSKSKKKRKQCSDNELMDRFLVIKNLWEKNELKKNLIKYTKKSSCYLILCSAFILFVIVNGGIVVGDRNAHRPFLHLCQVFYYSFFVMIFNFFNLLDHLKEFIRNVWCNRKVVVMLVLVCFFIVCFNTITHPYLLADNRHYVFYFWKKIYERNNYFRFLLIPVYIFSCYGITLNLNIDCRIHYWICTFLCLVPQQLLEFRYFIVPFILYRLEVSYKSAWYQVLETLWFILINCFTFYIFIIKTFTWPDATTLQRIIW